MKLTYYLKMLNSNNDVINIIKFNSEPSIDAIWLFIHLYKHAFCYPVCDWTVDCCTKLELPPKYITK